jgi:protein-S-isoprenylcysteine O-methyltransferase Ste14
MKRQRREREHVKRVELPVPEIGILAVTRAMLGAGVGLMVAEKLSERQRKVIGRTLFLIGVLSTIPLVKDIARRMHTTSA